MTEPREITDGIIQGVVFDGPIPESDADTDWQPYPHQYPRSDRQPFTDWLRDEQATYSNPTEYRSGDYYQEHAMPEQDIRSGYDDDLADVLRYAFRYNVGGSYQYATPEQMGAAWRDRGYGNG